MKEKGRMYFFQDFHKNLRKSTNIYQSLNGPYFKILKKLRSYGVSKPLIMTLN